MVTLPSARGVPLSFVRWGSLNGGRGVCRGVPCSDWVWHLHIVPSSIALSYSSSVLCVAVSVADGGVWWRGAVAFSYLCFILARLCVCCHSIVGLCVCL